MFDNMEYVGGEMKIELVLDFVCMGLFIEKRGLRIKVLKIFVVMSNGKLEDVLVVVCIFMVLKR